jgi:hypothetical protein
MAGKASKMAVASTVATEASTVATEASTVATATVATAASTTCERGGRRDHQNAGQKKTDKRSLNCSHKQLF